MGWLSDRWDDVKGVVKDDPFTLIGMPGVGTAAKESMGGQGGNAESDRAPWNANAVNSLMAEAWKNYNAGPIAPYDGKRVAELNPYLQQAMARLAHGNSSPGMQQAQQAVQQSIGTAQQVGQGANGFGQQVGTAGQNLGGYIDYLMRTAQGGMPTQTGQAAGQTDVGGSLNKMMNPGQSNPYLDQMMQQVSGNLTRNLNENIMPRIDSQAVADGAFGGSRQGVAQAMAARDTQRQIADTTGQMAYQNYNDAQNRALSATGMAGNLGTAADQLRLQQLGIGLNAAGLSNSMYGSAIEASQRGAALAPLLQSLEQTGTDNILRAGGIQQDYMQRLIDAEMAKYTEGKNANWENTNRLGNIILGSGGLPTFAPTPEASGISKLLGGLGTSAGAYGALTTLGMSNPVTAPISIGLGLLSAFG